MSFGLPSLRSGSFQLWNKSLKEILFLNNSNYQEAQKLIWIDFFIHPKVFWFSISLAGNKLLIQYQSFEILPSFSH